MTNAIALTKNLENLATLDDALWKAFLLCQKEYIPPTLNPFRAISTTIRLVKKGYLKAKYNYGAYLFFAIVSGALSVFFSYWLLISYMFFLAVSAKSRTRYVEAYATEKLGRSSAAKSAFGITTPSLATAGVFKLMETGGTKISKDSIGSIIKIVKASQEFGDVSFGIVETIKKGLFGLPLVAAVWMFSNQNTFTKYLNIFLNFPQKNQIFYAVVALLFLGLSFICYDLVLGQTIAKREKKKYLLVLNMIYESF